MRDEVQQCVGHTAHGGHDDANALIATLQHQLRDALKTIGIRETAAAELVDFPAILRHGHRRSQRKTLNNNGRFRRRRLFYLKRNPPVPGALRVPFLTQR